MRPETNTPRRVLVIDDNRAVHDSLRKILGGDDELRLDTVEALLFGDAPPSVQLCGFQISSAYQGDEGVQLARESVSDGAPFDVAFVDMRMPPGCDGVETVEMLWEVDPRCPVVLCSPSSEYPWTELIQRLGQNDQWLILKKPLQHAEVAQAATAMAVKRSKQSAAQQTNTELQHVIEEQTHELRRAAEEAERLLTAISSMLIGIDGDGRVSRWNDAASEAFGISAEAAMGEPFLDLPIRWTSKERLQRILSTGFHDREELTFEDNDSQIHMLGVTACPIRPHGGSLLVARDITQLQADEQQLAQTKKMEAIGRLAAGVAHEINTPMQYIGDSLEYVARMLEKVRPVMTHYDELLSVAERNDPTLVETIRSAVRPTDVHKMLTSVPEALNDSADGVQQVARIVRGLREFSHPQEAEKTPVDINHSLESTITVARREWKHVAEIRREFAQDLPLADVFGGELNQVFLNLLVNAAHSIGEKTDHGVNGKGTIRISTDLHDGFVEVQIEDDGIGMSPATLQRAFQPFFTTKPMGHGTGQGLAFAKKTIEERHSGRIWFESQEGKGACCFIQIPMSADDAASPAPATPMVNSANCLSEELA